ncbi:MAG: hypothetical protein FWG21_05155 [Oscillospiraceae bacterium]|nr:hypothetical protein [Oscillospiraceae bacterium]
MVKKNIESLNIIIPVNHPYPTVQHEVDAARILARHFNSTVEFIIPVDDYMRKSADILMLGMEWELKCPIGDSKATIENQFRRASKQAHNIVIDTRRTKLEYRLIENKVRRELTTRPSMKKVNRVILKDKIGNVVEIKK